MKDTAISAQAVRVSIPASVAGNIDGLKKSIATVLGKLGCPACCSGFDIRMELQRELALAKSFSDTARVGGWAGIRREIPSVAVGVKPSAVAKLADVNAMIDRIADMTGHPACATGCDLFFQMEELFVIDQAMNVEAPVMRLG
ncbi:hypothetical protein LHP98_10905 [Rhodobacter sp. Har01]|uniref:hypothetical protein n=1 Tax=Rhodobacter sp. Har01 TaxID=2883999 RepID=UPI001D060571|nr:hypothetical protein [Rhodobacter sp. Har01]MCB6178637.1 hypothetical protein [Rhodobacter sp. Har01]